MAATIKTWVSRVKPGRIEDAMALFREAKAAATEAEISLVYADSAGDNSGNFTLAASFPSAAAAGEASDNSFEDEAGQALWKKFNEADSPIEAVAIATYTNIEL